MNNNNDLGNGVPKIIPSARRGIRSPKSRIDKNDDKMVKFSDDSSGDEGPGTSNHGTDEVDNVQSKHRPLPMRRRNSTTPPIEHYSDFSYDNMLAKSLPATLPSHSNYRGEGAINESWSSQNIVKMSTRTETTYYRTTDSDSSGCATRSDKSRLNQSNQSNRESKRIGEGTIITAAVAVLAAILVGYKMSGDVRNNHVYDEREFHSDLSELGAKYKVRDNSILRLQTGISTIYKKKDTSCLIFVYNSLDEDFDQITFDGFVNNVASKASKFLRNNTASVQYYQTVEGGDLMMRSHSQLVKAFSDNVAMTGVLLVRDVEHVPSRLAMAFHYYCDEYNPLVKKSAIFFTLNRARCNNSGEKSSHATVEKCLKEKWNTVPKDNIGPLLTRVVNIVVDVSREF